MGENKPKYSNISINMEDEKLDNLKIKLHGLYRFEIFEVLCGDISQLAVDQSLLYAKENNQDDFKFSVNKSKSVLAYLLFSGYHSLP